MLSLKRKADLDGENVEKCHLSKELPNREIVTNYDNAMECSSSLDQRHGDLLEKANTNDEKEPKDQSKSSEGNISEQKGRKLAKLDDSATAGTLIFFGSTNWDLIGRTKSPKHLENAAGHNLWGPHRLSSLLSSGIKVKGVYAGCVAAHSVIVSETGQAYTWGRNYKGQLGHGHTKRLDVPALVETLKDYAVVHASCGKSHTLFLTDSGTVYACGHNKYGQCGVFSQTHSLTLPTKIRFKKGPVSKVACGAEFSLLLDTKGVLYSFGLPEYGALGHNSDGSYFGTTGKIDFRCELIPRKITRFIEKTSEGRVSIENVQIMNVACGVNHSIAVDANGRCYSWGFGGYGRLGHAEQRDEMVPRLIKTFEVPGRKVKKVFAGGAYSMAITVNDVLYYFGHNKSEATMYPKPVPDLTGWCVRDCGCSNTSKVVLADESVISWGAYPTYGELGYGDAKPKSSTTPQEVKLLLGLHIFTVAMGLGHTLLIARDETEEDKEKLEQIPLYTP